MHRCGWNTKVGGLLLSSSLGFMSNELRPVYAFELDLLGWGKHWHYKRQNDALYFESVI